jgi:hypothetical protein
MLELSNVCVGGGLVKQAQQKDKQALGLGGDTTAGAENRTCSAPASGPASGVLRVRLPTVVCSMQLHPQQLLIEEPQQAQVSRSIASQSAGCLLATSSDAMGPDNTPAPQGAGATPGNAWSGT